MHYVQMILARQELRIFYYMGHIVTLLMLINFLNTSGALFMKTHVGYSRMLWQYSIQHVVPICAVKAPLYSS